MGLKKVFLLMSCILVNPLCQGFAQTRSDSTAAVTDSSPGFESASDDSSAGEKELVELRARLRQIESMLLAQKDRENELLRDLNRMMVTQKDQPAEAETEARKNLLEVEQRFRAESADLKSKIYNLELALAAGHERDLAMGQQMNKTILVTVCSVAGIGLLVFLVTVYLQYRLISRPLQPVYFQQSPAPLEALRPRLPMQESTGNAGAGTDLVENTNVEDANERFLSAIERLEARIMHMEAGLSQANPDHPDEESANSTFDSEKSTHGPTGNFRSVKDAIDEEVESFVAASGDEALPEIDEMDVAVLEEEGKRYLQKENWQTAFGYFDQLARLDASRVDNWVNRGRALEMLGREDESLESYDRAIEANPDLPSPFLYKAALLSRLERFEEAQKYYNEALSKVPIQKNEQASVGR